MADQWAKPELGSGCVKITPAHDPNDYEVGLRRDLPMINILNPDGTLNANAGRYQGMTVAQARDQVVADLESRGLLGEIEDREIELAHSDRSKTPIEPYLADQWFVKMDDLAQSAMDAVSDGRVKIIPSRYAKGYLDWLGEKRDWPVSRQLWWGHRIPIWTAKQVDGAALSAVPRRAKTWSSFARSQIRKPERPGTWPASRRGGKRWSGGWRRPVSCRKTTCWTPGSVRPSGRTRRWAGPGSRPTWTTTTPPAC